MPESQSWFRRHKVLTTIYIVMAILFALAIAGATSEERSSAIGGAVSLLILLIPLFLAIGWFTDRRHRRVDSSRPVSRSMQLPSVQGGSLQQVGRSPRQEEPAAPADQSAFVETAHRPLPPVPQSAHMSLNDMLAMSPTEFEEFCVKALEGIGYKDVKRVGGAGDLTADIFAVDQYNRTTIAQCKRYQPGSKVGSPAIQTFIGMKNVHHQADRGIFMTTADYSLPAIRLAKQHDLVLIDGDDLVKIAALVMAPQPPPSSQDSNLNRFCASCGNEFPANSRFCPSCGQPR